MTRPRRRRCEANSLEGLAGEVGGLLAAAGQLGTEGVVLEPAAKGPLADAGEAGALDQRGGIYHDRQNGLLPEGETGNFRIADIFGHFRTFGEVTGVGRGFEVPVGSGTACSWRAF